MSKKTTKTEANPAKTPAFQFVIEPKDHMSHATTEVRISYTLWDTIQDDFSKESVWYDDPYGWLGHIQVTAYIWSNCKLKGKDVFQVPDDLMRVPVLPSSNA